MKFVDLIHAAMRECHDPISSIPKDSATTVFPTGFTIQLFLALLWSKVSVKRDLRDFYAGLKKVIPNPTNQKLDSSRWDTSSYAPDNKKCVNLSLDIEKWYSEAKHFQRAVYYISYTQSQNYGLPIAVRISVTDSRPRFFRQLTFVLCPSCPTTPVHMRRLGVP